jgi:hypothetical protein
MLILIATSANIFSQTKKACVRGLLFPADGKKINFQLSTPITDVKNPDRFQPITIDAGEVFELTKPCYRTVKECGREKAVLYGYDNLGKNFREEVFNLSKKNLLGEGRYIYLLTIYDLDHDSVSGKRLRLEFVRKDAGLKLVQGGSQSRCARGENTKNWTKELCP